MSVRETGDLPASTTDGDHEVPEWAHWPLKPDGKLDCASLMPATVKVCSKEFMEEKQRLAKQIPSILPKGDQNHSRPPRITNLTLLELYDLAGEDAIEFRESVLAELCEADRTEKKLLGNRHTITASMRELRRVVKQITESKSRAAVNEFLSKPANLKILGYWPRSESDEYQTHPSPPRAESPATRPEFRSGNRGSARVSAYNWRYKQWDKSISRNLSFGTGVRRVDAKIDMKSPLKPATPILTTVPASKLAKGTVSVTEVSETPPPTVSTPTVSKTPTAPEKSGEKKKASDKDKERREEVNFYCSVKANKVDPKEFGMPKGFFKCGTKMVHRKDCAEVNPETREMLCLKTRKRPTRSDKKPAEKKIKTEVFEADDVVMEDIEEEERGRATKVEEEVDVCDLSGVVPPTLPKVTVATATQTDSEGGDTVMVTEDGEMRLSDEVAEKIELLKSAHESDITIIHKLKMENASALKALARYNDKLKSSVINRNNMRVALTAMESERKQEKGRLSELTKQNRTLLKQNEVLLMELGALRDEIAARDKVDIERRRLEEEEE